MSYPGKRMKIDNNEPQATVPVAYATMTTSQDQQESQVESEHHPTASAEAVHVLSVVDESHAQQSSLDQGHGPTLPNPGMAIDPTVIQVVTFDEQPPEMGGATSEYRAQLSGSRQQEHTPLIHHVSTDSYADDINGGEMSGGMAECHDLIWAVLFYAHIAGVLYAGLHVAPQGYALIAENDFDLEKLHDFMEKNFVNDEDFSMKDLDMFTHFLHQIQEWVTIYLSRIGWFMSLLSVASFFLNMVKNVIRSRTVCFVSTSLVLFGVAIGLFVLILMSDNGFFGFLVSVVLIGALAAYIRKRLWPKREFAALGLEIAMAGLGDNLGTYVWVIGCVKLTLGWICFWGYTVLGLIPYVTTTKCPDLKFDPNSEDNDTCAATNGVLLALLISLYWTLSHVGATIQVYVAGVMGTWCFDKHAARGFCSSAVTSSVYRSLVFSAGPIAFGSLLQTPAKGLRSILSHSNRNQHRSNQTVYDAGDDCRCCCFGLCGLMLDCISEVFGDVLDYFSQWAYVFVGINGTSYLESGKEVMKLFQGSDWTAMITDRVLAWVLGVGILNGGIAAGVVSMLMERLVTWIAFLGDDSDDLPPSYIFGPLKNIPLVSFTLGFLVGCVVSAIMMNVIQGAVNTLIVCWAESPESFRDNHKYWADQITAVWSSAFPETPTRNNGRSHSDMTESSNSGRYGAIGTTMP